MLAGFMATVANRESSLRVLLAQYKVCWEDRRNFENMIWQTPTISIAIVAVVIAGVSATLTASPHLMLIDCAFVFAFAVTVVGTVQLRKQRFYAIARTRDIYWLEASIRQHAPEIQSIPFKTDTIIASVERYPDLPRGWIDKQKAYDWLFGLMVLVMMGLLAAIVYITFLAVTMLFPL